MTAQLDLFGAGAPAAPVEAPAPAARPRAPRRAALTFAPPSGPERTHDADEFEARLHKAITLRPYQREGARWLSERRSALLADEPGVGKTATLVAAIDPEAPVVIVCPAVARDGVWPRHLAWRPDLRPLVVRKKKDFFMPGPGEAVVTNYELLPDWLAIEGGGEQPKPGTVAILDEAHLVKNPAAERTRRAASLCARVRDAGGRSWLVTGHPLKNKPIDLWHLLGVAGLQQATWRTERRFCRAFGRSPETWEWTGEVEPGVPEVLRRVMLRREFADVVKDMPPRQWEELPVEISPDAAASATQAVEALKAAGIDLESATREVLLDQKRNKAAGELMRARALLAAAKVPALLELLDAHEEESERPIVVFSAHAAPIEAVARRPGWAKITGGESPAERARLEAEFQAGRLKGVGITIRAGGVAITLSRARRAIFVDRDWTPADNEQAEGRIYRADDFTRGTSEPVIYTDLVADHAIDRRLAKLLQGKRDVTAASVGAASVGVGEAPKSAPVAELDPSSAPVGALVHDPANEETQRRPRANAAEEREPKQDAPPGHPSPRASTSRGEAAPGKRHARTPVEFWAEDAVVFLAREQGVSAFDAPLLRALVTELERGLDDRRWQTLVKVCRRYARLVGDPPAC